MLIAWRQQGGCAFADAKPGGGMWVKNPKPSMCGLVSGMLCGPEVWGGAWMWWVHIDCMEVGCAFANARPRDRI